MNLEISIIEQLERSALQARRFGELELCITLLRQRAKLVRATQRNDPNLNRVHEESIEALREVVDVGILNRLIAAFEGRSLKRVGFWWSRYEPWLPRAQDGVDPSWDATERAIVIRYLERSTHESQAYFGESTCRICNTRNGCRDISDGVWVWPDGLVHYLREHRVKPPADFLEHVRSKTR